MTDRADIFRFLVSLQRVLQPLDDERSEVWSEAQELCAELRRLQSGARARTLAEAAQVARLDYELRDMPAAERNAAITARLGCSRRTVFRLRKLSRSANKAGTEAFSAN